MRGLPLPPLPASAAAAAAVRRAPRTLSRAASASAVATSPRLLLLRHGESADDAPGPDYLRPLTSAGREAVRALGVRLAARGCVEPQLVLCSDTTRARQTLAVLTTEAPTLAAAPTRFLASLYVAAAMDGETARHLREVLARELPSLSPPPAEAAAEGARTVLCIGHNKGWAEAASELAGEVVRLPTASAALLESGSDSWEEALGGAWRLVEVL